MLASDLKIKNKRLLEKILKQGRVYRTPLGLIKYLDSDKACFAVVVSKKQLKLATDRNRAKRRMKALIMQNIDQTPKVATVIYLNTSLNTEKWQNLCDKWQNSLKNWPKP